MELGQNVLVIALLGGIIAMDTTVAWQIMISQPLVAGFLVGVLWGNVPLGLTIGLLMELPWLSEIPAGGTHFNEGNIGSVVTTAIAIDLTPEYAGGEHIVLVLAILWGTVVSLLNGKLVTQMRRDNGKLIHKADEAAGEAQYRIISLLHLTGVLYAFGVGLILTAVTYYLGLFLLSQLVARIPQIWNEAFGWGIITLLGVGCGSLLVLLVRRENFKALLIVLGIGMLTLVSLYLF